MTLQSVYYVIGIAAALTAIATGAAARARASRKELHDRIDAIRHQFTDELKKLWERTEENTRQGDTCERNERDLRAVEELIERLRRDAEGKHDVMEQLADRRHDEFRQELRHVREDITKLSVLVAKATNGGYKV